MKTSFYQKLKKRYKKIIFNKETKNFIKYNENRFSKIKNFDKNEIVLIDFFDHEPWNFFYSDICYYLKNKFNFNVGYFHFVLHKSFFSKFSISHYRLNKIYNSFSCVKMINKNNYKNITYKNIKREIKKIKTKKEIEKYKYKKILIGDLIYDTYLRTTFEPTVNIKNKNFFEIFSDALKIYEILDNFFQKNKVRLCIPSHTYYIQFGILTRLAIFYKIPVVMIHSKARGNKDLQLKKIINSNPSEHNYGYISYKKDFKKLKSKIKLISIGKKILINRLRGKTKLSYLKTSPYKGKLIDKITKDPKIFIFCHDFFDSVHKFRKMIFLDFYEQLTFLINFISSNTAYKIYIKPHPNHMPENNYIFAKLKKKFDKKISFLDKNSNNYSLAKSKPDFIITNNGTIAHEIAYFEIPVINTGDNPHISYNFSLNPKNLEELKKMILNINKYKRKINFSKKHIYEFVYMHYVYLFKIKNNLKIDFDQRYNFQNFTNQKKINFLNTEYIKIHKYFEKFFKKII